MQEIDAIIDNRTELALEMVNLDIRNRQAHEELQAYNDTKEFKYSHSLTINSRYKQTQREKLKKLKEEKPAAFINEIANLSQNIKRIQSNINKKKYKDEKELQSWQNNLEKAKIKHQTFIELM